MNGAGQRPYPLWGGSERANRRRRTDPSSSKKHEGNKITFDRNSGRRGVSEADRNLFAATGSEEEDRSNASI